jgi:hypothetical protein
MQLLALGKTLEFCSGSGAFHMGLLEGRLSCSCTSVIKTIEDQSYHKVALEPAVVQ